MTLRFGQRFIAMATAVLFVLSIVGHGVMMAAMAGKAVAATADMSFQSPPSEGGCDGDDTGMQPTCFAHCASILGIVSDSIQVSVTVATREAPSPVAPALSSRNGPPDPYPPKPFVMI